MTFKLYILTVLIPLNGQPSSNLEPVPYQTPCFHLEKVMSGETLIDQKTQLRMVTKARCVPDQVSAPLAGYGPAIEPPTRQFTPYDLDDPLNGYNPLEGIVRK